jgi:YesN/AraC family two-component response regulator
MASRQSTALAENAAQVFYGDRAYMAQPFHKHFGMTLAALRRERWL